MSLLKWMIPICIGSIIFGNHYARDTVGALEKQIEMEFGLTTPDYATLNSLFFVPNMITPFIAGVVTKKLKPSLCLIYIHVQSQVKKSTTTFFWIPCT